MRVLSFFFTQDSSAYGGEAIIWKYAIVGFGEHSKGIKPLDVAVLSATSMKNKWMNGLTVAESVLESLGEEVQNIYEWK